MPSTKGTDIVTLAAIRRARGEQVTQYLFNERQQIFTLRSSKSAEESARRLRDALRKNIPVKVLLDPRRALIQRVAALSPEELEEFRRHRTLLDKPDPILRLDVSSIDPTTFNIVDYYLRAPSFRLCRSVVPNYMTAKKIFDYCAKQSCHLPGPYNISPCIPFQYVRDGCYARAHKMRWIITTKYRYCCEKVFSFAVQNFDHLAVKADKWGGCCVTWWYHVAPLIRVRVRVGRHIFKLAMVVDPSMFDKPVLLSTWLSAQQNKTCDSHAHVSMYSIQPGSAYAPAWGSTTTFTTDPSYTATDSTLNTYHSLVTCP